MVSTAKYTMHAVYLYYNTDLILKPSDTLYIYEHAHEDCLDVSSPYDTNLNESKHLLSLQIRATSVSRSKVIFSRQYLNVYITDYHGKRRS